MSAPSPTSAQEEGRAPARLQHSMTHQRPPVPGANLPNDWSVGVLILICAYICGHAGGWGPIGWLYPCEIQPLETRAAGASINTASNLLFTFVIGMVLLLLLLEPARCCQSC